MFRSFIYLTCLLFMVLACGTSIKAQSASQAGIDPTLACQLPRVVPGDIALGFPKVEGLAPSTGKVNVTVLFVDFDDAPATKSPDSVFAIINPIAPNFFKEVSYGRMELNLQPHLEWLRVSKSTKHYGMAIYRGQPHLNFIQEAVDLANDEVDFSQTHIVVVMCNPTVQAIAQGPTFKSSNPEWHIRADGASIPTGITSGYDLNYWGGIWLPHEIGHTFGLPDLYHFGSDSLNRYVGTFGLMGTCAARAPGYFAFERWVLGWLDNNQMVCHDSGEAVIDLSPIEKKGGIKAVVVPLDSTSALVVESRRQTGFDKRMRKEGALVYVVNTSFKGGSGPIRVRPGVNNGDMFLQDAPMGKGQTYTYKNVMVEVLESNKNGDRVKIQVKEQD